MTSYTFRITALSAQSQTVTVEFTDTDDQAAARKAEQLRLVWNARRDQCRLTRNAPTVKVPRQPNSWRKSDPKGPFTNIPILINNRWFTPNGMPIFDINAYKARCRSSAAKVSPIHI